MRGRALWGAAAAALLLGVYFVLAWERSAGRPGWVSFDTYQYFYPNMLYAARSLADGGRGFFWNAMVACGQPFFSISSTSTLYPLHWLFFVLDADLAMRAVLALDLAIAGLGAYLLCRELGLSATAAFTGAMCFELGNATIDLATWMPLAVAPFVWLPMVMLACERVLREPGAGRAAVLGLTLAMAILSGYPQIILYICQLVGLRLLWELATRRRGRPIAATVSVGAGLVLALLLTAIVLLPAIETGNESVRGIGLTRSEIGSFRWETFQKAFDRRTDIFNPIVVVPAAVAAASLATAGASRRLLFYGLAGALSLALAFGDATPLFDLYLRLPFGRLFREPARFLWISTFCLAVLAASGLEALVGWGPRSGSTAYRVAALAAFALSSCVFWAIAPSGLRPGDWLLIAIVAITAGVAIARPRLTSIAALAVAAAIGVNLVAFPWGSRGADSWSLREMSARRLVPDGGLLRRNARVFEGVRARMTPQDRAYLVHPYGSVAFMPKTGSLFDVPVVQDYEPQPGLRFAEYFMMMRRGTELRSATEFYAILGLSLAEGFQRRLLDLTGARFLVVHRSLDTTKAVLEPAPRLLSPGFIRIYENPLALARARYVARVEIVADKRALLRRLASGDDDLGAVAFVEAPLPSRFTGSPETASGEVEFVRNDPEDVVLRVRASRRGFLHLADQYAAGWYATVNGSPVPIARANYLFRLVEVPAGESIVEFRYAPLSIRIGALISALSAAGLAGFGLLWWRRSVREGMVSHGECSG